MSNSASWMKIATKYKGQKEIKGNRDNPVIMSFFAKSGHPNIAHDETPWCSAFVGAVMHEYGVKGTNALNARSWLKWDIGKKVRKPRYGDIVIFWRGSKSSWKGHVAFFEKEDERFVWCLGGNQGDQVKRARYAKSRVLGYVRPPKVSKAAPKPTVSPPKVSKSAPKNKVNKGVDKTSKVVYKDTLEDLLIYLGLPSGFIGALPALWGDINTAIGSVLMILVVFGCYWYFRRD